MRAKQPFMRLIFFLFISCLVFSTSNLKASADVGNTNLYSVADSIEIPKVFIMGEYETAFEKMTQKHEAMLMAVCDNNMDVAFDKWLSMLKEMEAYSGTVNFDLKGIKMWLNVFWDPDGTVNHIAYYLKPNSKNIDTERLTLFFIGFMNNYKFPLVTDQRYSHYGSAAFPTFPRRVKKADDGSTGTDPLVKDSMKSGN